MNEERRIFAGIEVHGVRIDASGGLLDLSYKPYRRDRQYFIGMTPAIAREVAAAMLQAADAADGRLDTVDPKHLRHENSVIAAPKANSGD